MKLLPPNLVRAMPLLLLLGTSVCHLNISELECEIAVGRLEECCSGFVPGEDAKCDEDNGCDDTSPDLTEAASACIQAMSCAELSDRGICRYFLDVRNAELVTADEVCP